MFWESVLTGLGTLLYWETYAAALLYLLTYLLPLGLLALFGTRWPAFAVGSGCLGMIGIAFIQTLGATVFVLTMSPIILGTSQDATWAFPWQLLLSAPGPFLLFVAILYIVGIAVTWIPIIGDWEALGTLVQGGLGLVLVLEMLQSYLTRYTGVTTQLELSYLPGFWFIAGIVAVWGVARWLGLLLASAPLLLLRRVGDNQAAVLMFPLMAVLGFIPVFIYGAWLGEQLQ